MRVVGMIALAIGIVGLLVALNMDTSVATSLGGRVNNIGLINDKQNLLLVFAACSIVGSIFVALGGKGATSVAPSAAPFVASLPAERACPFCAEQIKAAALICRYCQKEVPPSNVVKSQPVRALPMHASEILSAAESVSALVRLGCRVTRPSEEAWEVLHPSGVTAMAYSPEALHNLAVRYAS